MTNLRKSGILAAIMLVATLLASGCSGFRHPDPGEISAEDPDAQDEDPGTPIEPPPPTTVDKLFTSRPVFGVSLPELTTAAVAKVTSSAGCQPMLVNRFTSVAAGMSLKTLKSAKGTPMVSLEPWHSGRGAKQSDFTLKATVDGKWDTQYKKIAQSILAYHDPVLVRFAHEMNGDWYPWGATNGNTSADFVAAWRHVVDLFRGLGAANVLWVWSPNILRGASSTTINQFWPGPDYVDIVGVTGYGVREPTPDLTFGPTLTLIEALTDKPLLLTETGAKPDSSKPQWISGFGDWLLKYPKILGFVWFQSDRGDDFRFDDTPANLASFKNSLKKARVSC